MRGIGFWLVFLGLGLLPGTVFGELGVEVDFPGGSGVVSGIDQGARVIRVDPTLHEGKGWRCWWYFKLTGMEPGKAVRVDVGEAPWATPDRAAYRLEGEVAWRHTERGVREGKRIVYTVALPEGAGGRAIWMAWGPPFLPADAAALVERVAVESKAAEVFELCVTREGRATPGVRVAAKGGAAKRPFVWVQARQHAWESGSSWVAKGFIEWLVSDDRRAVALRERAEVVVVPIMDIDNVYRGAGGKNQAPQDHNRDWSEAPHWNAVAAAQARIRAAEAEGRMALFVDLHNPGANSKFPFFYVSPESELSGSGRERFDAFHTAAKAEIRGPLRFIGQMTVSGPKYDPKNWRKMSMNWVVANCGEGVVATTLETAWNTAASTSSGYETVGRQLGLAVELFLREE